MSLSVEEVLAEAAAWVWVPEDAEEHRADDYWLIAYPPHFAEPTVVTRIESERPSDELVDVVLSAAAEMGRDDVVFRGLGESTRPHDLEATLLARGAELVETVAVMALDLRVPRPSLDAPTDVVVRQVLDIDDLRELDRIDVGVFGGKHQTAEQLAVAFARLAAQLDSPNFLAWRGGVAVGSAGHTVAGDVLRLWGGACVPEARHTGVYRALLDHRLRAGEALGCRMALVKGRVATSAPVLRRAGFVEYGAERSYLLRTA
jgi:hypothetical protein